MRGVRTLGSKELRRYAYFGGFQGNDAEWEAEYEAIQGNLGIGPEGATEAQFEILVDSEDFSNRELQALVKVLGSVREDGVAVTVLLENVKYASLSKEDTSVQQNVAGVVRKVLTERAGALVEPRHVVMAEALAAGQHGATEVQATVSPPRGVSLDGAALRMEGYDTAAQLATALSDNARIQALCKGRARVTMLKVHHKLDELLQVDPEWRRSRNVRQPMCVYSEENRRKPCDDCSSVFCSPGPDSRVRTRGGDSRVDRWLDSVYSWYNPRKLEHARRLLSEARAKGEGKEAELVRIVCKKYKIKEPPGLIRASAPAPTVPRAEKDPT